MRVIFQFFMHISDIRICMSFYWNIMYLTLSPSWKKYFSILLQCQHLRGKVLTTMSLKCIVYPSAKSGVTETFILMLFSGSQFSSWFKAGECIIMRNVCVVTCQSALSVYISVDTNFVVVP